MFIQLNGSLTFKICQRHHRRKTVYIQFGEKGSQKGNTKDDFLLELKKFLTYLYLIHVQGDINKSNFLKPHSFNFSFLVSLCGFICVTASAIKHHIISSQLFFILNLVTIFTRSAESWVLLGLRVTKEIQKSNLKLKHSLKQLSRSLSKCFLPRSIAQVSVVTSSYLHQM